MSNERQLRELQLREHFVPDKYISLTVLRANLAAYFGSGARIDKTLRFPNGDVGWLVDGGRVTPAILEDLRRATEKREQEAVRAPRPSPPTVPLNRNATGTTTDQVRTLSNAGRTISNPYNRPAMDQASNPIRAPSGFDQSQQTPVRHALRKDNPSGLYSAEHMSGTYPPAENAPFPTHNPDRYRLTDAIDIPPGESRQPDAAISAGRHDQGNLNARQGKSGSSNRDYPEYAARHPERDWTVQDFDDWNAFQRFLALKQARESSRMRQDDGSFTGERTSAYKREDAALGSRVHDFHKADPDPDPDPDPNPDYGQQKDPPINHHAVDREPQVRTSTRNLGGDGSNNLPGYGQQRDPQSNRHAVDRDPQVRTITRNLGGDTNNNFPDYGQQRDPQSNRHAVDRDPQVRTITRNLGDDGNNNLPDYGQQRDPQSNRHAVDRDPQVRTITRNLGDDGNNNPPGYGQQRIPQSTRHTAEREPQVQTIPRNLGDDEMDEDSDATPDYNIPMVVTNSQRVRPDRDGATIGREGRNPLRKSGKNDKDKGGRSRK